jgi:hypothetical protein
MKIYDLLSELRRNPEQNIKQEGHAAAVDFLSTLSPNDLKYYGVTLTHLPKLGINPRSEYNTPLAICFYPADYYLEKKSSGRKMEFQDSAPYIQIIEIVDNFVEIDQLSTTGFSDAIKKLYKLIPNLASTFKVDEQQLEKDLAEIIVDSTHGARTTQPGSRLWYILMRLSSDLTNDDLDDDRIIAKRTSVVWNKLLRMIGYDVILDNGSGILHPSEPFQGMAFTPTAVKTVKMFYNTPKKDTSAVSRWKRLSQLYFTMNPEDYLQHINDYISANTYEFTGQEYWAKKVGLHLYKILNADPRLFNLIPSVNRAVTLSKIAQDAKVADFLVIGWVKNFLEPRHPRVKHLVDTYVKNTGSIPIDIADIYLPIYTELKSVLLSRSHNPDAASLLSMIDEFTSYVTQHVAK